MDRSVTLRLMAATIVVRPIASVPATEIYRILCFSTKVRV